MWPAYSICNAPLMYDCCTQSDAKNQPSDVAKPAASHAAPATLPMGSCKAAASSADPTQGGGFPGFAPLVPKAGALEGRQIKLTKPAACQSTDTIKAVLRPPVPSVEPQLTGM